MGGEGIEREGQGTEGTTGIDQCVTVTVSNKQRYCNQHPYSHFTKLTAVDTSSLIIIQHVIENWAGTPDRICRFLFLVSFMGVKFSV